MTRLPRLLAPLLGAAVLLPLGATPAGAAPARPTKAGEYLTGRVVVRYTPSTPRLVRARTAKALGGRVAARLSWLNVDVLDVRDAGVALSRVAGNRSVRWAEPELRYQRHQAPQNHEGAVERKEVGAAVDTSPYRGSGIKVGVIDDGVWPTADLGGSRLVDGGDCSDANCSSGTAINSTSFSAGAHGTAVANLIGAQHNSSGIRGTADLATVHAYRVFPSLTSGATDPAIVAALRRAAQDGMHVVNLSLGNYFSSRLLRDGFAFVRQNYPDLVIVASAGNDGSERASYPAALPGVLSVGAAECVTGADLVCQEGESWRVADFSTGGDVDIIAPGVNVRSWYTDDDSPPLAPNGSCGPNHPINLTCLDGTSFSAPIVSGLIASLASAGVRGDKARATLAAAAKTPTSNPLRPGAASGSGRVDLAVARNLLAGTTPWSAAFFDGGAVMAGGVGRRPVELLRVDPDPVNGVNGPAGLIAAAGQGTVSSVGTPTTDAATTYRLHRSRALFTPGTTVANHSLQVGAPGEARAVPITIRPSTIGPEPGGPDAGFGPTNVTLSYGSSSSYIRKLTLAKGETLRLTVNYPGTEGPADTYLFIWLPDFLTGGNGASDAPFREDSGADTSTLSFTAPYTGTYTFGLWAFGDSDPGTTVLSAKRVTRTWRTKR
jgi:hypothetical protein